MLSSSRLVRSCTPRACAQRSVVARAAANADELNLVDAEAVAGRVSSAAESAVDTLQLVSGEATAAGAAQLNDLVDRVKDMSEDVYAAAIASGSAMEMPSLDMSQFSTYAEKASQLSADVMSQSSSLAGQLSTKFSEQLETLPEVQAQLSAHLGTLLGEAESALADATDASEALSRQVMNEIVPRVSSEVDSLTQLAAEGHYADAAASPAGIAAAGIGVLLIGGIAASSSSSAPASSAPSTSSTASTSPAAQQDSAEALIEQWRGEDMPQDTPDTQDTPVPTSPPPIASSSEESSSSSGEEALDPTTSTTAAASSNGAFPSNGAAPAVDAASSHGSADMTFAEYVSGGASADEGAAGGWYVASDSEPEDSLYSGVYAPENGGAGTATSWRTAVSEAAEDAAAPSAVTGTESEGEASSGMTDTEGTVAGTATLAGALGVALALRFAVRVLCRLACVLRDLLLWRCMHGPAGRTFVKFGISMAPASGHRNVSTVVVLYVVVMVSAMFMPSELVLCCVRCVLVVFVFGAVKAAAVV